MRAETLAQRLASIGRKPWAVPAGLFVAILLTYGPAVPWLGFYWDDWPTAWFGHLQGPGFVLGRIRQRSPDPALALLVDDTMAGRFPVGLAVLRIGLSLDRRGLRLVADTVGVAWSRSRSDADGAP